MGTIAPGTQGMALSDTSEDGAPVQIGASVDSVTPEPATEGQVRRLRASPAGLLLNTSWLDNGAAAADAVANAAMGRSRDQADQAQNARMEGFLYYFNGVTWDRMRGDTNGLQVMGPAASDAPELGNPVQIGASVDNTAPAAAAEGNVRRIRTTPLGELLSAGLGASDAFDGVAAVRLMVSVDDNQRALGTCAYGRAPDGLMDRIRTLGDVALDGLGQLCATPAVPGASGILSARESVNNSSIRFTMITPTAGTRIRIVHVIIRWNNATAVIGETYFGLGANIASDTTKAVTDGVFDLTDSPNLVAGWPDGAGPVGLVDEVLSGRVATAVAANLTWVIHYREE